MHMFLVNPVRLWLCGVFLNDEGFTTTAPSFYDLQLRLTINLNIDL